MKRGRRYGQSNGIPAACHLQSGSQGRRFKESLRCFAAAAVLVAVIIFATSKPLSSGDKDSSSLASPQDIAEPDDVADEAWADVRPEEALTTSGRSDSRSSERNWWKEKGPEMMWCKTQPLEGAARASLPCRDMPSAETTWCKMRQQSSCTIRYPAERPLPPELCPQEAKRVLLLSFITTATTKALWKQNDPMVALKNRLCYVAARDYRYVLEVVDASDLNGVVPVQFYKPLLVQHYLSAADWLVYLDFDLVVMKPQNWFEQYLAASDDRHDLILADHAQDVNNGAFMLKNSDWGRAFAKVWVDLAKEGMDSSSRGNNVGGAKYPFTDNGPFTETVLRFGTKGLPSECSYVQNSCLSEVKTTRKVKGGSGVQHLSNARAARLRGLEWLKCVSEVKSRAMGAWRRDLPREMGRILFLATDAGFNSFAWADWKDSKASDDEAAMANTFYENGMFMLHSKHFGDNVPTASTTCPQTKELDEFEPKALSPRKKKSAHPSTGEGGMALGKGLFRKEGAYMLSANGICSLSYDQECREEHFFTAAQHGCTSQMLGGLVDAHGIQQRKSILRKTSSQKRTINASPVDVWLSLGLREDGTATCGRKEPIPLLQESSSADVGDESTTVPPPPPPPPPPTYLEMMQQRNEHMRLHWFSELSKDDADLARFKQTKESSIDGEYDWWLYHDPELVSCAVDAVSPLPSSPMNSFKSALDFYVPTSQVNQRRRLQDSSSATGGFFGRFVNSQIQEDMQLGAEKDADSPNDSSLSEADLIREQRKRQRQERRSRAGHVQHSSVGHECHIRLPHARNLPPKLCDASDKQSLRVLFVTVSSANVDTKLHMKYLSRGSPTLALKNRACYVVARGHRYIVDIVDTTKFGGLAPKYKLHVLKAYLPFTDWLVYLDPNAIVRNPHNWMEQYFDDDHDLIINDHHTVISAEAFAIRNTEWGRAFMDEWISRSDKLGVYPFKEGGSFAEAVLRFGTRGGGDEPNGRGYHYRNDTCSNRAEVAFQQFTMQDVDDETERAEREMNLQGNMYQAFEAAPAVGGNPVPQFNTFAPPTEGGEQQGSVYQGFQMPPAAVGGNLVPPFNAFSPPAEGGEQPAQLFRGRVRRTLSTTTQSPPSAGTTARRLQASRVARRSALQARNQEYVECLGEHKDALMGPWSRTAHRSLGRVRFVSTAAGFGAQEYRKTDGSNEASSDGTASTMTTSEPEAQSSFSDGNFIVHSQHFMDRVTQPSMSCPQVTNSSFPLRDGDNNVVRFAPPLDVFSQNEGVYLVSVDGICDMNTPECKRRLFQMRSDSDSNASSAPCMKRHLQPFTRNGVRQRKQFLRDEKKASQVLREAQQQENSSEDFPAVVA